MVVFLGFAIMKLSDPYPDLLEIDLVKELKRLSKDPIKSLRRGDTGVGYTLENLLNIRENNSGEPDFKYKGLPVELKTQREGSSSRVTLMTKTPHWDPLKPKEIVEKFGYVDSSGRKALKATLTAKETNSRGFKLCFDECAKKLKIVHKDRGAVAYFNIGEIMDKLKSKLYKNLILVLADGKKKGGEEFFVYEKAVLLQALSEESFEMLLKEGLMVWEFRMHLKENGNVRGHGPGFRISESRIDELYSKKKVIFEI